MKRRLMVEVDAGEKTCDGCPHTVVWDFNATTCGLLGEDLAQTQDGIGRCASCLAAEQHDATEGIVERLRDALLAVLAAEAWDDPGTCGKQTVEEWIASDPAVAKARAILAEWRRGR